MRICHIITGLEMGGAEKLVLGIARKTAALGHPCAICVLWGNAGLLKDRTVENIEVIRLRRKIKWNPFLVWTLYRVLKKVMPDIVHTHLIHATLYGRLAARWAGVPVIVTTEHNTSNWQTKYGFVHLVYRWTAGWNTKIFAVSDAVMERMVRIGRIKKESIQVLYNGIDVRVFHETRQRTEKKSTPMVSPVIGTVGRLDPRKGHRYLLEASVDIIKRYPEASILIIGSGKMESSLKQVARSLGLKERNIRFLGIQNNTSNYLQSMDVFVLPSVEEGLGIAILEAMAAEVPVVATSVGGIPEIITHGETGILVEPKNPKMLADAVIELLTHPEKADRLRKKAKDVVMKKYDIQGTVEQLMSYYQQFLEKSGCKRRCHCVE